MHPKTISLLCAVLALSGAAAFAPGPILAVRQHGMVGCHTVRSLGRATREGAMGSSVLSSIKMGIKAVDNYDSSFELKREVMEVLAKKLNEEKMEMAVQHNFHAAACKFSGKLFQPVPYSENTPHGMPREFEQYYCNPDYAIVNIPPQIMFDAKCLKPSRLCAIYELKGVDESHREKILADRDRMLRKDFTHIEQGSGWQGMGKAIQVASKMNPLDDDADLDSMVV